MVPSILLLLAILLAGTLLLAVDLFSIRDNEAEIALRETLADTLERSAKKAMAAASANKAAGSTQSAFLQGETATIAAAALQGAVIETIRTDDGQVNSVELTGEADAAQAVEGGDDIKPIKLEVTFEANLAALQAILFHLEHNRPQMVVDGLQLSPILNPDGKLEENPTLHAVLNLHGYWRAG
jgi:hypothetical protein